MKNFYVTTPIYYPNQKPNIGAAYTTLAADILARYWRAKNKEVFFLTGTDEHGAKIARQAKKQGKKPQDFCDQSVKAYKKAWQNLNISNDDFIRTTQTRHIKQVEKFLLKIKPYVYKDKYEGLYCTGCEKFITKRELVGGKCPYHKKVPEKISEENYFFKLSKFLPQVKKILKKDIIKVRPLSRKNETLGLIDELEDFSLSREKVKWGIPLPWDKKQTIYVWIDALLNYWSAGQDFWPPNVHLIGKDILKFHCIYWPALLLAYGLKEDDLPRQIFVHGFFTINGEKMSKSLGNVIYPEELIDKFGIDGTRYLLLSQFSFGQDGDFSMKKLEKDYRADLANDLGNLVKRAQGILGDVIARKEQAPQSRGFQNQVNQAVENFQFNQALKIIWQRIAWANKFIDKERLWEAKDKKKLGQLREAILEIAQALKPFLPETSAKIFKGKKEILFPKI